MSVLPDWRFLSFAIHILVLVMAREFSSLIATTIRVVETRWLTIFLFVFIFI